MQKYKLKYFDAPRIDKITIPENGYYLCGNPIAPTNPAFATVRTWQSNTGAFSVFASDISAGYVVGSPGTVIMGLVIRYWFYA